MTLKSHAKFEEKLTWKMTSGIQQIFIRTFENVKIGLFMGFFCSQTYRSGVDSLFQN